MAIHVSHLPAERRVHNRLPFLTVSRRILLYPIVFSSGADFFIVLPASTYSNFKLTIKSADGRYCVNTANATASLPIYRSQFTTIEMNNLSFLPQGALPGEFTYGNTKFHFSKGNLQYSIEGTHVGDLGNNMTGTWRFAEHQADGILAANTNFNNDSYTGWIDLFGWGSGNAPRQTVIPNSDCVDWGQNAISNGGNQPGLWRALTYDEFRGLTTGTRSGKYGQARVQINGSYILGIILLPDNWNLLTGGHFTYNGTVAQNSYTVDEWEIMETAGAVFLPKADRLASGNYARNYYGWYWTSSLSNGTRGYMYYNANSYGYNYSNSNADIRMSVRLVYVVPSGK